MIPGVLRQGGRWLTLNLVPGQRVYRERLRRVQGQEYREWSPRRSKLAAYLERGGRNFQPKGDEQVLYLGAASGTTVSHVSDLVPRGRVFAVEFAPRPFRDLLHLAAMRTNIVPILSDASAPEDYGPYLLHRVPVLYQDIAQRNQAQLFAQNAKRFLGQKGLGFLAVKARSINVARPPRQTYDAVKRDLVAAGLEIRETVELDPLERDHAMLVVEAA
ncbi:MAG TPA: fibrillarin-like rRNA/tRNA 2'-O-methyltransferase [Candidatus Thermoplasmatota archaeon]|nr:fibrillarin-like rRNA/tRNA 2'-O-methyltransferase [Candidatus Thermoplasmatota archaeon]